MSGWKFFRVPVIAVLAGLFWIVSGVVNAAEGIPVRDQHVEVRLLSEVEAVAPGGVFRVGVEYRMDPEWHIYWTNPGESGLPPIHDWKLPDGSVVGDIRFPPPERYEAGGMVTFVHHDRVLLIQEIQLPETLVVGDSLELRVIADWLMCRVPCIPGRAELSLRLPVEESIRADPGMTVRFDAVAETLPRSLPEGMKVSVTRVDGDSFDFSVLGAGAMGLGEGVEVTVFPLGEFRVDQVKGRSKDFRGSFYPYATGERDSIELVIVAIGDDPAGVPHQFRATVPLVAGSSPQVGDGEDRAALSWLIVGAAFLGGIILNVMPCVFPVLGLKVLHISNQAGNDRKEILRHGGAYTLGILVSFWVLAVSVLLLRSRMDLTWGFQLQEPVFLFVLAVLLLLFALNLSGVFEIGGSLVGVGQKQAGKEGLGGSFLSGVLATTVSTPCSAPILGTALSAVMVLPGMAVWILLTMMGLGLATPFVLLSVFPPLRKCLPRPGPWMETFKQLLAFPLYGTAVWLLWSLAGQVDEGLMLASGLSMIGVAMAAWIYGRFGSPMRSAGGRKRAYVVAAMTLFGSIFLGWPEKDETSIVWEEWSPERVEALRAEGRPIYVDFTARWCLTCKLNKARVFGSGEVIETFRDANVATLKADLTSDNPVASRVIESFGRGAVPMNLIYLPGNEDPILLPELLRPEEVLGYFNQR